MVAMLIISTLSVAKQASPIHILFLEQHSDQLIDLINGLNGPAGSLLDLIMPQISHPLAQLMMQLLISVEY